MHSDTALRAFLPGTWDVSRTLEDLDSAPPVPSPVPRLSPRTTTTAHFSWLVTGPNKNLRLTTRLARRPGQTTSAR
ncbi:hypothetical protein BJ994_000401 [Arthrobacter pigmenti]|uniref:Uncharacterized protein n=1 Tax=Arthrobacter pigmenti TaxID=271432 RepID=A0A846RND9_9MICC|nr:hypothetical protein [Arthrobacter pigmenti]NJC21325.1 hypothetical protein [Arthrobacter pigmenti]